jgi:lipopolysaccharide transport system ATP-binding protein
MDNLREPVLELREVAKAYTVTTNNTELFYAIKNISFSVKKGEFVTIIGKNGCGKSTLLKCLSGITKPTNGTIKIVGSLLSINDWGSGVEPELTGYQNIKMVGKLYGIPRDRLPDLIRFVETFSELGDKLFEPVKHFSQGMYLRLAFSIIAFLDADVLVFDEIMAVGDVNFRKKCFAHLKKALGLGRTVILATHNMEEVIDIATRAILLWDGQVLQDGEPSEVYQYYQDITEDTSVVHSESNIEHTLTDVIYISKVYISQAGKETSRVLFTEPFNIEIEWVKKVSTYGVTFTVFITDANNRHVISLSDNYGISLEDVKRQNALPSGNYSDSVSIPAYFMNTGRFYVHVAASVFTNERDYTGVAKTTTPLRFNVVSGGETEADFIWKHSLAPIRMKQKFNRKIKSR